LESVFSQIVFCGLESFIKTDTPPLEKVAIDRGDVAFGVVGEPDHQSASPVLEHNPPRQDHPRRLMS
jgi:hypothetical protein